MKEIKTFVTEKLGIKYPIIAACMQWISKAELVAAVSEAGGHEFESHRDHHNAKVAELVDALASGVSVLTDVGVQVPPLAPRL